MLEQDSIVVEEYPSSGAEVPVWNRPQGSERPSLLVSERKLLLASGDVLLLLGVTWLLNHTSWGASSSGTTGLALAFAWLGVGYFAGLYAMPASIRRRALLVPVIRTGFFVGVGLLLSFYLHQATHHQSVIILSAVPPVIIAVWRLVFFRVLTTGRFYRKVLLVGAGPDANALLDAIASHEGHAVEVVGIVDDSMSPGSSLHGVPVLGGFAEIWACVARHGVEEVVVCRSERAPRTMASGLSACYERGVAVSLMPHLYEEVTGQVPVEYVGTHWLGAFPLRRKGGTLYAMVKRCIEIAVSAAALLVAAPLMLLVAILVRLSSPGPILFRQPRAGLHGHPFHVIKFRTMYVDAGQWGQRIGDTSDRNRITPIGKWLRRLYLDELPQLFLVLKGDMSLIGPRPKRLDQARELEARIPLWRVKYSVKPGLTGWGQIQYGYAHSADEEMARLKYDLYYVKYCSPLLDVSILVRTAARVFRLGGT